MNCRKWKIFFLCMILCLMDCACRASGSDPQAEAPPPLKVQSVEDPNVFEVDRPERFALTEAVAHAATSTRSKPSAKRPGVTLQD